MNAVIDELSWRGLIAHSTDLDALGAHLDEGPITSYVGFDPTAPSIHMGNLVQVMVQRVLQRAVAAGAVTTFAPRHPSLAQIYKEVIQ